MARCKDYILKNVKCIYYIKTVSRHLVVASYWEVEEGKKKTSSTKSTQKGVDLHLENITQKQQRPVTYSNSPGMRVNRRHTPPNYINLQYKHDKM